MRAKLAFARAAKCGGVNTKIYYAKSIFTAKRETVWKPSATKLLEILKTSNAERAEFTQASYHFRA